MYTVLCDCEAVVNTRHLTYISSDCNDLAPLTPNIFLQVIREVDTPDLDNLPAVDMREKTNYSQKLRDDLRHRFRSEYLGQLRENAISSETRELNIGDLVLVGRDNQKRLDWPLGRIVTVFKGKDGKARVYRIKTASGELTRPIQRLYPFELDYSLTYDLDNVCKEIVSNKISQLKTQRKISAVKDAKRPSSASLEDKNESQPYVTRSGRAIKKNVLKDFV